MKRSSGFTLIELMITVVIIAILVTVALPSYQRYVARAVRASAQQFMTDVAQRQEQYFIDARGYAPDAGPGKTINMSIPDQVAAKYNAPVIASPANGIPAPSFSIQLVPQNPGLMATDGDLWLNNLGQRWREVSGGNGVYDAATDCLWEKTSCIPQ